MKFHLSSSASTIALGAALIVAPAIWGGQADATPINGSDSIITLGDVTPTGGVGDLLTATGFTVGSAIWGNGAGNFSPLRSSNLVALTQATLTMGSLGTTGFTSSYGNYSAVPSMVINGNTFTSAVVASSGSIASGTESLSIYLVGNFTPLGALSGYDPNNASETISFTETGISGGSFGSFSVSATFAAPASAPPSTPSTNAPEPASLALLGAGLLGLGATRRRKD